MHYTSCIRRRGWLLLAVILIWSSCAHIRTYQRVGVPSNKFPLPESPRPYPEFTHADSLHGMYNRYRTCYDVHFYALDLHLNPATKQISGTVTMHFHTTARVDTLQVDLTPELEIASVRYQGRALSYHREASAVFVVFDQPLATNREAALEITYRGTPREAPRPPWEGGLVWDTDQEGRPWLGVACEMEGASIWWPCKDHFADRPDSALLRFTVPEPLQVVSNGRYQGKSQNNGSITYQWWVSSPINVYNITFYAGHFKMLSMPYPTPTDTHRLQFYVLDYHTEKGKPILAQSEDVLSCFEERFGPFPWWSDGYKLVESPYPGMEHQTAIAYGSVNGLFSLGQNMPFDYILVHETAHEWWGNSVTASDIAHLWLHEGFATYSEILYLEAEQASGSARTMLKQYKSRINNDRPVVGPEGMRFYNYQDSDIYTKGAWILHSLRHTLHNDSLFNTILYGFATTYARSMVETADFIAFAETQSGRNLQPFFRQYLYHHRVPVLEYALSKDAFYCRWQADEAEFDMPVELIIERERRRIHPKTDKVLRIPIEGGAKVYINTHRALFRPVIHTPLLKE